MKIIQVHNYYQQAGGEDAVVAAERAMLEEQGHQIVTFYKTNDLIVGGRRSEDRGQRAELRNKKSVISRLSSVFGLLRISAQTIWNWETYKEFRKMLRAEEPDVVHCHNTFPLISPSIYWACAKEKVPVVQTLHNYRLLCLNAYLFRIAKSRHQGSGIGHQEKAISDQQLAVGKDKEARGKKLWAKGSICELCVRKSFKWPGIRYRCYHDSMAGSFVVAVMLFVHKLLGTWSRKVTAYIALTEFQKQKMVEEGIPEDKIWVKPNFIQRTEVGGQRTEGRGNEAGGDAGLEKLPSDIRLLISGQTPFSLFVGRLSPEKGYDVLLKAWAQFCQRSDVRSQMSDENAPSSDIRPLSSANNEKPMLLIVGDGPERANLELMANSLGLTASLRFLGKLPKPEVLTLMHNAQFLVLPSIWYEGFPMTIVEAFSCATPVVASNDGGMHDAIEDMKTGLLFPMGDDQQLADILAWAFDHPEEMNAMGGTAKKVFEESYSAKVNYRLLTDIYRQAASL